MTVPLRTVRRKKGLHITHNDSDAIGCALVASFADDYKFEHRFMQTGNSEISAEYHISKLLEDVDNTLGDIEFLMISDVSITLDIAEKLEAWRQNTKSRLLYVDHHITNPLLGHEEEYPWFKFAEDIPRGPEGEMIHQSAASKLAYLFNEENMRYDLKYDYEPHYTRVTYRRNCNSETTQERRLHRYSEIITSISRYDTYEWKLNPVKNTFSHHRLYDEQTLHLKEDMVTVLLVEKFQFDPPQTLVDYLAYMIVDGGSFASDDISCYFNYHRKTKEQFNGIMNRLKYTTFEGYTAAIYIAEVGLITAFQEFAYNKWNDTSAPAPEMIIWINPLTKTLSFRSKEDHVDVSEVAKRFGGGGHFHASGAVLDTEQFLKVLELYYNL